MGRGKKREIERDTAAGNNCDTGISRNKLRYHRTCIVVDDVNMIS